MATSICWFDSWFNGRNIYSCCSDGSRTINTNWNRQLENYAWFPGGLVLTAGLLNSIGSVTNLMFEMPPYWHLVVGGFAFGAVFMAADPVTAPNATVSSFMDSLLDL